MQTCLKCVATVIFFCIAEFSFSFQDTTFLKKDTLDEKTVQFAPNFSWDKVKSLGNYVGVVDDSLSFRFSSGISVLNTLRGRVPSTGVSVEAPYASVRENAVFVIDGILYRQNSGNFYNMNAFDYTSITVLNRGNAASAYGVYGGNGVFVLKSKTGENNFKPTIEFNAYTVTSAIKNGTTSGTVSPGAGHVNTDGQSYISHAIAYMQDFGKVDTRVSYNFLLPLSNAKSHNIKINTGFDLHPKFNARLIVDNLYNNSRDRSSSSSTWISDSSNYQLIDSVIYYVYDSVVVSNRFEKSNRSFLQGSLILQYYPTDWLTLSSQSSLGKVNELEERTENLDAYKRRDSHHRSLINFFATVNKKIGSSFTFSTFAGFQYESLDNETKGNYNYAHYSRQDEYYFTGVDLSINDFLFAHFDYRKDVSSVFPESYKQEPTHSASLAFIFSDAFNWRSSAFSFGKVRTSIGKMYEDKYSANYLSRTQENVFEIGTDFKFANNRIGFSYNYFNEMEIDRNRSIDPTSGFVVAPIYNGNLRERGSEFIVNATPVITRGFKYDATLLWVNSKTTIENGYSTQGSYGISNPTPSWTSSILNQVTWKNIAFSFLIDARKGGTFYSLNGWSGSYPNYVNVDGTQIKLRDLSIGYQFPKSLLKHIGIRQAFVSSSVRNLLLLYSKSGKDVEEYFSRAQKSTSLNLNLLF